MDDVFSSMNRRELFFLKQDKALLMDPLFKNINTNMLIFHFEPLFFPSIESKLSECSIQFSTIEEKDIYIFDDFFHSQESQELRHFSEQAQFSKRTFASYTSRENGEEPARAMDKEEKWKFFNHPPQAIKEVYQLLSLWAHQMKVDITTQPWDICYENACLSAIATNRLESNSLESMEKGKHDDYNTEEGIAFGIPILYSSDNSFHPTRFINGSFGKPWLVTLMLYAASEDFKPEYGIGTIFCTSDGEKALREDCRHMRFILFEGHIIHGIEESRIPPGIKPWRVSYVFKLTFNPTEENQSIKKMFYNLIYAHRNEC